MSKARHFNFELQVQRIDHLYKQSVTAPILTLIFGMVMTFIGWKTVPHGYLFSWLAFVILAAVTRTISIVQWRRRRASIQTLTELQNWHFIVAGSIFLTGIWLGFMGMMTTNFISGVSALSVGLLILGIIGATIGSYSSSLISSIAILLPTSLLWGGSMLAVGGRDNYITAFLLLVYVSINFRMAYNWYTYSRQSMEKTLDLHEKEERLRHNRDASGAVDWEWNLRTDAYFCEGHLAEVFGIDGSVFKGDLRRYLDRVHPSDRASLELAMTAAIQTGSLDAEHRVIWPTGEIHHLAVRGRVQYDEFRKPARMNGIAWDITAKKTEEQLRHERDLYEAADKAKLVFLANASHEIRTPLSAINGFAELVLGRRDLNPEIIDDVNVILRNGKYLAAIVNDLLDLSKSEADHLYIQKSTMSPMREINDSLLVVQSAAKQKGLWIRTVYETPVPEKIYTDATRFRQILINLLTNAIKYTHTGGATVYVSYRSTEKTSFLRIVVSDTGMGITEETKKGLFQPFMRGQSSDVQRISGSGLGLALSRNLARKMGGDIRLLNMDATGAEKSFFEFTVDTGSLEGVRLIKGEDFSSTPLELVPSESPTGRLAGKKILLVEDQADLRELMQRYLEANGARLVICNNGQDAVNQASNMEFDAILMDIQMPILDGYEATKMLRDRGYAKPIVALTAHASTADRDKCYHAGCDYYLSKPVNTGHLLDLLTRQMKKPGATIQSV